MKNKIQTFIQKGKAVTNITFFSASILLFIACSSSKKLTLKSAFKDNFFIGAAMGAEHILEKNEIANELIKREFNTITSENIMKSEVIHPEKNRYDFLLSDKYVSYGQNNGMYIVGHTLIWHSQLSKFANKIENKDSLHSFMTDHINTIVNRYKGKINAWDVVNEALNEDGTYRESIFYKLLGEKYIKEAFDLAAKADPTADLYYNDYNIEQPKKRAGVISLIKKLKASGTKVDGVGIQGHWSLLGAPVSEIEAAIVEFSKLGVKVAFTELDITVIPNPWDLKGADVKQSFNDYIGNAKMNPYTNGLPDSVQTQLAKRYEAIFKIFIKHQDKISRVTFWGINDGHSWLNGWPIKKRTNYPLLFDRNFSQKPAYQAVIGLKVKK